MSAPKAEPSGRRVACRGAHLEANRLVGRNTYFGSIVGSPNTSPSHCALAAATRKIPRTKARLKWLTPRCANALSAAILLVWERREWSHRGMMAAGPSRIAVETAKRENRCNNGKSNRAEAAGKDVLGHDVSEIDATDLPPPSQASIPTR